MRNEPDAAERGVRQLSAILPSGRNVWLRVAEPLAPAAALESLARLAERESDTRRAEISAHGGAIERLTRSLNDDFARLQRARLSGRRRRYARIVSSGLRLEKKFAKARDEFRSRLEKQLATDRENLRRLRRRELWDKVLLVTSLPLFAAYGDRDSPFGSNNLALTFLLLVWLAGDHLVQAIFGSGRSKSRYALEDADAWSYLAPIANVLAAWWLLGNRQHERFVTGVTTVALEHKDSHGPVGALETFRATVDLGDRIGTDDFADFALLPAVPAVPAVATFGAVRATGATPTGNPDLQRLTARVRGGQLILRFEAVPQSAVVDIAWIVDTAKPAPAPRG